MSKEIVRMNKMFHYIKENQSPIDYVVLMLGTNDCKSYYSPNEYKIGKCLEQCIDKILETVPSEHGRL